MTTPEESETLEKDGEPRGIGKRVTGVAADIFGQNATLSPDAVPDGFTPAQVVAMGALLAGKPKTTAARMAGVSRSTIYKWLADDPIFMSFYNSALVEMAETTQQNMRLLTAKAVVTLRRLLTRRSVPDAVKLAAAVAVLKLGSAPIQGPTEPEDAANTVLRRKKAREMDTFRARIGVSDKELLDRLDPSVGKRSTDLPEGFDDEDDDELEDREFEDDDEDDDDLDEI